MASRLDWLILRAIPGEGTKKKSYIGVVASPTDVMLVMVLIMVQMVKMMMNGDATHVYCGGDEDDIHVMLVMVKVD